MPLTTGTGQALAQSSVIITEMQPGTEISASQEFIELYNQSHQPVDLKTQGWRLEITTAEATSWSKAKSIDLEGIVQPGTYYLLARNYTVSGESKSYLQDYAAMRFTSAISSTSGHIRLVKGSGTSSQIMDRLEWSVVKDGVPVSSGIDGVSLSHVLDKDIQTPGSIKRVVNSEGHFMNSESGHFVTSVCPSPTATIVSEVDSEGIPVDNSYPTSIDIDDQTCLPHSEETHETGGGIVLPGDEPPAVLLPAELPVSGTSSNQPSNAMAQNVGLKAPLITELLPNPAAPQTDAEDEFIELYNSNDTPFALGGYKLAVGVNGSKTHTFAMGTTLPPKTFVAFYVADTKASLSNTSGQARLRDPLGNDIAQTDQYGSAKEGQAWALADGKWQWTTRPTPHATNVIIAPAVSAKNTSKKSSSSGASKTVNYKTSASKEEQTVAGAMAEEDTRRPIHAWILAGAGVFAVLYGAYEYRRDLANQLYRFKLYRAARRENRQRA